MFIINSYPFLALDSVCPTDTRLLRLLFFWDGVLGISSGSVLKSLQQQSNNKQNSLPMAFGQISEQTTPVQNKDELQLPGEHFQRRLSNFFQPDNVDIVDFIAEIFQLGRENVHEVLCGLHYGSHGRTPEPGKNFNWNKENKQARACSNARSEWFYLFQQSN